MLKKYFLSCLGNFVIITFLTNSFALTAKDSRVLLLTIPLFIFVNICAGAFALKTKSIRLKICHHGSVLIVAFVLSAIASCLYHFILAFFTIPNNYMLLVWSIVTSIVAHFFIFWNGILCIYLTSLQLGIKQRVIGIIFGCMPFANLIVLVLILRTVIKEINFEYKKEQLDLSRKDDRICKTKYPILLVHGVCFRDNKHLNYWGRIPKSLLNNGAELYYGNHQSAACIADSAAELTDRIKKVLALSGAEKVNIIAHSKGGLDCRYAIANLGAAPHIASLTTINTPHRGCVFADYLLTKVPEKFKNRVASTYNKTLKKLGDESPDFLAAMTNLTATFCKKLDAEMGIPEGIYCQSVGSVLKKAKHGKFPLNWVSRFVKYFDGPNDGLVSGTSFKWGENYTLLNLTKKRGISHADVIDLNRENIDGFDVREFYIQLVSDLRQRGL